ncbi:MAG: cytidylate kinase family protein [Clostridia bacterium]|nr:cytidylate kinase family protein [Clostridia bacterium]MDD4376074.1 cytidylate kinase family protein [Clostridia bacterium]
MKKKNMITINGHIAGGKSRVVKIIAKRLNMGIYSASYGFRELARKSGMDLASFNEYIKDNSCIDKKIDEKLIEFLKNADNVIVDSRLAWFFEKDSFKVFIKVDIDIASKRLVSDSENRNIEDKYSCVEEAKEAITKRQNYERERYLEEYNIDIWEEKNYDLIFDSSNLTTNEMADYIIEEFLKWKEKRN